MYIEVLYENGEKALFVLDDKITFNNKSNDILAIGELLVDMIATDYDNPNTYQQFFGGAPANIAMNVKKLGINSLIAAAVGEDRLGEFLTDHLTQNQITTHLIQKVEHATSMVLLTKSSGTPSPIFYRNADFQLSFTPALEDAILNSNIIHFSCWPLSRLPARNTVKKAIEIAQRNQVLICFDPNYHQSLWQKDEDSVAYIKSIIGKSDIIKPSEDDAQRIFGSDTPENQVKKFLALGAKLVIMTLGKEGLIISNGKEFSSHQTKATEVVDTTGAGDAFWSGFYTAIIKGYTIRDAISFGSATSAYKLKHLGAVAPLPKLEALKEIYDL